VSLEKLRDGLQCRQADAAKNVEIARAAQSLQACPRLEGRAGFGRTLAWRLEQVLATRGV
jgi:hypothetical protein